MIRRVDRQSTPARQLGVRRKPSGFTPFLETPSPELALAYSNGFVTVEISVKPATSASSTRSTTCA
jgi:hypothetical protein